ncbi:MAG: 4-vinyl reductase [Candidatus Aenigmatarchaeota archaeon]
MFTFFTKLVLSKQMKFEEGSIILYGQPIIMFPVYGMIGILKELEKNKYEKILYYEYKTLGKKWTTVLRNTYKIKKGEIFQTAGSNILAMAGWGIVKVADIDSKIPVIKFRFENSSVANAYGKTDHAVCHMFRGMAAGAMCIEYGKEMDGIETKCKAMGAPYCEVVVKPSEQIDFSNKLVKSQLNPKK